MKSFTLKFALLFLLGVGLASTAAAQKIGGVVKDSAGKPVIGVSVVVDGTTLGASSGVDGRWTLTVPDASKKTLVISYIGMKTQRIAIGSKTQIDVRLEDESTAMDDVVVVGYATVKRRDVVGSVASVNAETLQQMPVASVAEAMTGRMAGVQVTATEGDPDAEIRIRVRGAGSFSSDGAPLYIVDGFPVESISDISSSEIQSIDILKDAFSTAIYGSRGANGVVLITTKSGEKGKVNVNYNVYWGFKDIARKNQVQALNPSEFARWQYELAAIQNKVSDNYEPYFGAFSDIDLYDGVKGNDWMDQLFGRSGEQFNHNLTVSGGGDKFKWNATYARLYDKAIMIGSNYSRDNLGLKTQFKASKRITLDFNIRYSRIKVRGAGANSLNDSGSQTTGRLKNAMLYTPIPLKAQIEGGDDLEENSSDAVMPTVAVSDSDRKRERTNWNANAGFTWEIVDDLRLKVEAGMEEYRQETNSFYGVTTYYSKVGGSGSSVPGTPSTNYNDVTRRRVRNTNTLNYDFRKLISNDDHHLNVLLGQEYIITEQRTFNTWVDGLPDFYTAEQAWTFMGSASNASSSNMNYAADDILLSYFGRINYDFKGKYMLSATMRGDGSSKFSKGRKWGYFPSVAASWRLSDEWGMKDLKWLDNLKLRYSFGTAGNNNIPTGMGGLTQLYEVGTGSSFIYGDPVYWTPNGNGASESYMANANLTWETTYSHNLGLDFGFWRNRLSGSVEVYQNTTEDILMRYPVSGSGYSFQYRNAGTIRNRGLEVSVAAVLAEKAKWGVNFNANIAFNRSRIMDLAGLETYSQSSGWNNNVTDYYAVLGGAIGDIRGYTTLGRYEVGDFDLDYYNETGKWRTLDGSNCAGVVGDMRPGSLKLLCDENGAPVQGKIGNVQPKFTGGFSLSAYAYGFDVAANFTYSYGNKVFNANNVEFTSSQKYTGKGVIRNLSDAMALGKRWTNVNWETGALITDPAELAAANAATNMWSPYMPQTVVHSWLLEDASFLRLSSLTVGYTLPASWTRKVRINKVRLYATGTNLFCWTPYSGFDPEVDTRRATPMTPNVDYSAYPKSRSWVFGANISF